MYQKSVKGHLFLYFVSYASAATQFQNAGGCWNDTKADDYCTYLAKSHSTFFVSLRIFAIESTLHKEKIIINVLNYVLLFLFKVSIIPRQLSIMGVRIPRSAVSEEAISSFASSQGVTQRCRLSWLTTSVLVFKPKCGGGGGALRGHTQLEHFCSCTQELK